MLETIFWMSTAAIVHHHVTYPLSLMAVKHPVASGALNYAPTVTIVVAAFQEVRTIAAKITNLGQLDYPRDRLKIRIECDGCTDETARIAESEASKLRRNGLDIQIAEHHENRGKIATLNAAIVEALSEIIVLSDASSRLRPDALLRLCGHFSDPNVGIAGGVFDCEDNGSVHEKRYWRLQNQIRLGEAALGSPLGMSGAFYAFSKALWTPLEADTINDDFILPMRIVAKGYKGVLDPTIKVFEAERTRPGQDFSRRKRIGAGNLQQAIRCIALANPLRPTLAYAFISGKALRSIMPFILVATLWSTLCLAADNRFYAVALAVEILLLVLAVLGLLSSDLKGKPWLAFPAIFVSGYVANGIGAMRLIARRFGVTSGWTSDKASLDLYVATPVAVAKRLFDVCSGLVLFAVFLLVLPILALAIKMDSAGPVFYSQIRVGRRLPDRTELFRLIKFRTMRTDAEKSGASWAVKGDSRITRFGDFMRKTRLDELPQAINVLRGEMSMIGPRPERPSFFQKLEANIPLYIERTYSVAPGITGLAQVRQGYDETIEDVRSKVGWDHAYAMQLGSLSSWARADFSIALETIMVMVRGRGQ